jgi:nucleotide-binding universal stress UspA family protein
MIKDVVVNLQQQAASDPARDFAISVAKTFGAHIAGVSFAFVPDFPGYISPQLRPEMFAEVMARSEEVALAAIDRFEAAADQSQVSKEHRMLKATEVDAPVVLSTLARRFDLSVFMQSQPNVVDNDDMVETSLFESGRPLIVVPYIQRDELQLDRLICCWDGSRAATRAIHDALPFLVKAGTVDLLIVLNEKTSSSENEIRGVEIARHLARHGVRLQIQTIEAADIDVTNAILSYAADRSAQLIVMGGYGHSRLRQIILGGVTRDMFKSMTVPVFMSH